MAEIISIYGTNITLPECDTEIEDWGESDAAEQYSSLVFLGSFLASSESCFSISCSI